MVPCVPREETPGVRQAPRLEGFRRSPAENHSGAASVNAGAAGLLALVVVPQVMAAGFARYSGTSAAMDDPGRSKVVPRIPASRSDVVGLRRAHGCRRSGLLARPAIRGLEGVRPYAHCRNQVPAWLRMDAARLEAFSVYAGSDPRRGVPGWHTP